MFFMDMSEYITFEVFLILLVIFLITIIFYMFLKSGRSHDQGSIQLLQDQIFELNKMLESKLHNQSQTMFESMNKNFETTSKISEQSNQKIEEITQKLTELSSTNQEIKNIWGQLEWLEKILKNPKQRGNLGEYFLQELLENIFQEGQYALQYKLESGAVVDAALFLSGKIIPIDSKFPHDNYQKLIESEEEILIKKYSSYLRSDIKKRIDETSKYVQLENNTTDFAFMLIPAEWLYYDIFISKLWDIDTRSLIEYAFSKKVIVCSPSSFYAYLQTVVQWLKALKVEEKAKEILQHVEKLSKDIGKYEESFEKLWNSLWATVNHYNSAYKRLGIIDKDIVKISDGKMEVWVEVQELEKPQM